MIDNMKTMKAVEYSYPTSANATRFKLANGGYCVELVRFNPERRPPVAVAGFKTLSEAKQYAEALPESWDQFTL